MAKKAWRKIGWWLLIALLVQMLAACSSESTEPRATAYTFATPTPSITPRYLAVPNQTPTAPPTVVDPTNTPLPTPTAPPTAIVAPTPAKPVETVLSNSDLGVAGWTDTRISWSPKGDYYVLQVINEPESLDFYFLIRPPTSVVASYRLSRSAFQTLAWSSDGRYLSYIAQDAEGNAGAVRLVDTTTATQTPQELFRGPCSSANWLDTNTLIATCGTTVFKVEAESKTTPEQIFKLDDKNQFPGSPTPLNLIARSLPSPDGKTVAIFGLQRAPASSTKPPVGEIGLLDLESKKFSVLDRNSRPVAPVDWTPDSKFLVLRNLTSDWSVAYTFDFYLADPAKLKISQNLTKSNPDCDPVLDKKECQGIKPSSYQTSNIVFALDANRYFVTALKYTSRPTVGLQVAEQLYSGTLKDGKLAKLAEQTAGTKVVGLMWLPNNRYFFSAVGENGGTRAFVDNKPVTLTAEKPKVSASEDEGSVRLFQAPSNTAAAPPTATAGLVLVTNPPTTPTAVPNTPVATTPAPVVSPTLEVLTVLPVTAEPTFTPRPTATALPTATPKPSVSAKSPVVFGYFLSPLTNWLIAVERIAEAGKPVQFQLRLLPFTLK